MIQEIEISKLKIHPRNVRKTYRGIEELAESIKAKGILQNLTVVPDKDEEGTYLVVIGNRRLTAARMAGISTKTQDGYLRCFTMFFHSMDFPMVPMRKRTL